MSGPLFLVHGHNDCADGCRGEQQGDNLKRQHIAAHQRDADIVYRYCGHGGLLRQKLRTLQHGPSQHGKHASRNHQAQQTSCG